jgi:hypothetical protein
MVFLKIASRMNHEMTRTNSISFAEIICMKVHVERNFEMSLEHYCPLKTS